MKLTVATCYFPVDSDIISNKTYILKQMRNAKERRADVAHFSECALSGYAGADFDSYEEFDWELLKESTEEILDLAGKLKIWVVLGSSHKLTGKHKPHNSLYIIGPDGKLVDRYDKLFCAGDDKETTGDLKHYTPGTHFSTFEINGIKCGALICHDYRYPELYREYKKRGVRMLFHSYHAGNVRPKVMKEIQAQVGKENFKYNIETTLPGITMPATMITAASQNYVWISCSNTSARESCWPSFFVRPDGVITGKLRKNIPGVLISKVNTKDVFYDSTIFWRDRSMNGIYHSGKLVKDKRSDNRKSL